MKYEIVNAEGSIGFDSNRDDFNWDEVTKTMKFLVDNEYEALLKYEDCGIYVIEYCYSPRTDYGANQFLVVTADEADEIWFERSEEPDWDDEGVEGAVDEEYC